MGCIINHASSAMILKSNKSAAKLKNGAAFTTINTNFIDGLFLVETYS